MEIFKNNKQSKIFESIIFTLIGIVSIILSFFDILVLCYTLAGICFVVGIFYLFGFFYMLKENNQSTLSRSIILIVLSAIMVFFHNQFIQILPLVLAVFLFYLAIQHFTFSLDLKAINEHHWKFDMVFSFFILLCAIVFIILDAINGLSINIVMLAGGITYVVINVTKLLLLIKVHPSYNKRTK